MLKVHIVPPVDLSKPDPGDGGIGRVVRAQYEALPKYDVEIVDSPAAADVIHCHVEIPPTYLRLYGEKPFVVTSHGFYWTDGGYQWDDWCYTVNQREMASIRVADAVTAVSEWVAQSIRRNTLRPVEVVPHGIDPMAWMPVEPGRGNYVLWNKTRVDPICDPEPMNAVARLLPSVQFVSTFGQKTDNVEIIGKLSHGESAEIVRHATVYLVTTRETWGIGTLEAMAAGIPVVGFAYGGQREIIRHGHDGWLVQPGDIEGLAEGIEWAMRHRDTAGAAARNTAMQYTIGRAAAQYARIYSTVLERKKAEQQRPKVSVIVPAYQMGDYLDDALRSVKEQTLQDFECIVVNDASPDPRDAEIASRYIDEDQRFRHVLLSENGYLANARNVGIASATGQYIFPLDADDQLMPTALEVLAGELDRSREFDIAYGNVRFVEADGHTPRVFDSKHEPGHSGWPMAFRLDWMLEGPGQLLPYASMYRRRVWEMTGGYRVRSRSSEDQDFWLRATSYGFPARYVTQADTLIYRLRDDSMSSTEGWEEHRPWFPWVADRSLIPGGAVQEQKEARHLPLPAFDPAPIAVVIPVGPGHQQHVYDAIDSVDAQTFRNFECLVVNDTGERLPPLPSWVKVIELECIDCEGRGCEECRGTGLMRWGGAAAARNAGIAASTAPLFLPLDADDYLQPRALEVMLDVYVGLEEPTIIYSDFWEDPEGELRVYETPDYDPWALIRRGALHAVTALTPRKFWEEVGGYDEDVAWEDWSFALSCAAKGRCSRRVALPLFTYRKHTGMRREQNMADFERSKAAIMSKDFGLQRGGELLACSRCGAGRGTTSRYQGPMPRTAAPPPEGAVLIRYTGARAGEVPYRSRVDRRTTYRFSTNRPEGYVHKDDAQWLMSVGEFQIVEPSAVMAQAFDDQPLVAARPPVATAAALPHTETVEAAPQPVFQPGVGLPRNAEFVSDPDPEPDTDRTSAPDPADPPEAAHVAPQPPADPEPVQPASEEDEEAAAAKLSPAAARLMKSSREELNRMAQEEGVTGAEHLRTKADVANAIAQLRAMMGRA